MFGEISIWAWMGSLIVFAIGGATGFFISRQLKDKRTRELEEKLTAARTELSDYRSEVNQHFLKTSLLVSKLTNDYREVYEHLATGAQKLCQEKPGTPKLDLPETKILPQAETFEELSTAAEPASETASDKAIEATAETGVDLDEAEEQIHAINAEGNEAVTETPREPAEQSTIDAEETSSRLEENKLSAQEAGKPAPEDVASQDEGDEDVPLGAESAPSVDTELHKTHPSIH